MPTSERAAREEQRCERCNVKPGDDCVDAHGQPLPKIHAARLRAYRDAHPRGRPATGADTIPLPARVGRVHWEAFRDRWGPAAPQRLQAMLQDEVLGEPVIVTTSSGDKWPVYPVAAQHAGRCAICQREHRRGATAYLAHGVPFCQGCVDSRPGEVAARVAWARAQRSKST